MKKKIKIGTTLFNALMAAMIITSATLTISAKTEQTNTASEMSAELSVQSNNNTYMILQPREKLIEKFESVPEVQVVEKYVSIKHNDTPEVLDDIDSISIKNALIIDGKENDMLRTFDNLENAIAQIYKKAPTLLNILDNNYALGHMNNDNWKQYQHNMNEYLNNCIQNDNQDAYKLVSKDEVVLKTFFDIYENTEQNNELIMQVNGLKTRSNQEPLTVGQLITQLPNNTPLAEEVKALRTEENLEQINMQQSGIQTRDANVANYFNINRGRDYALKWATMRNFNVYGTLNADCTNFTSQILYEGGFPMHWGDSWYWWCQTGRYPTYGNSWINANSFCGYYFGIDYTTNSLYEFSGNLREGDFIAYDGGRDGSYDHVGFVAWLGTYDWHANKYGHNQYYRDFVVAQHTSDYQAWVSSATNGWDNLEDENAIYARVWTR